MQTNTTKLIIIKIGKLKLNSICHSTVSWNIPVSIYMFKVKNRNTSTKCELCSKLTIKKPERRLTPILPVGIGVRRHSGVIVANFEYISHLFLVFLLLTLSR